MARGKLQMKKIDNPVHRQVTFCKRRGGLLKKAKELSVLCDAHIGIIIFSNHGKLFELSTNGTMQGLVERYMKSSPGAEIAETEANQFMGLEEEINLLNQEIQLLEKGLRFLSGEVSETMNLDELRLIEKLLEIWIYHVRSAKMQTLVQEIQLLKNKEGMLQAANEYLQGKMEEQNGVFDFPPNMIGIQYPLTIPNEIFEF